MMGRFSVIFAGTLVMVASIGCAFQPKREAPGGATGGGTGFIPDANVVDDTAVFRSDAAVEYISVDVESETGPTTDANCGNVPFSVISPPPEILIVLDRSGSMNENAAGMMLTAGDPLTKWVQVTTAINAAVAASETKVNWGLKLYGTGASNQGNAGCVVADTVAVPPGPNNAMAITDQIALPANQPATATPTRLGVMQAANYLRTLTTPNPKYILLATDGAPNCGTAGGGGADAAGAVAAVMASAAGGIPVFVIGIAATPAFSTTLDQMAVAGGRARMGTPSYYSASTTMEFVEAINAIQAAVAMCTYPVGAQDPMTTDFTKITVTVDGNRIEKDVPDGWIYDAGMTSVTFTGTTCARLMAGEAKAVQILFGCKVGPVEYRPDPSTP